VILLHALLLLAGLMVASFGAAAVLVAVIVRLAGHFDDEGGGHGPRRPRGRWDRAPRRFDRRGDPASWPQFERAFADYVRTRARQES
jgi:hypothetical protein